MQESREWSRNYNSDGIGQGWGVMCGSKGDSVRSARPASLADPGHRGTEMAVRRVALAGGSC